VRDDREEVAMPSFVGIDPVLARALVADWRAVAGRVAAAAARAAALGQRVALPPVRAAPEPDDLLVAAALLAGRTDDLSEWLAGGDRGWLATELAAPSAAAWSALVAAGSTTTGARTVRYVDIGRDPGGGVIVADFFIPDEGSVLLAGDDRAHADPIFGSLTAGDSRAVFVLDLERGRASISFDDTCTMWSGALEVCAEARPIATAPVFGRLVNEVSIDVVDGHVEVDYDILNGITPIGSTDGTFALAAGSSGRYAVAAIDADEYPSLGIYQYRPGQRVDVLLRRDSEGASHLLPWWPELPDLPDLPDLPALPTFPLPDPVADLAPDLPDLADLPNLPDLPSIGGLDLPDLPDLPGLPDLPDLGGLLGG
jgi:hypothetical protein